MGIKSIFKMFSKNKNDEVAELRHAVNELAKQNIQLSNMIVDLDSCIKSMAEEGRKKFSEIEKSIPRPEDVSNVVEAMINVKVDTDMLEDIKGIYYDMRNIDWGELEDVLNIDFDDFVLQYDMEEYINRVGEDLGNEIEDRLRDIISDEIADNSEDMIDKAVTEAIESMDFGDIVNEELNNNDDILKTIARYIGSKLNSL